VAESAVLNRRLLLIDLAIAVIVAAVVFVVSPGVAVGLFVALIVIVVCAISFGVEAVIRRRRVRWYRRQYYDSGKQPRRSRQNP
jgi:drug/metabolite transporter (DMT)-like permease